MAGKRVVVDTETEFEAEAVPPAENNGVSPGFFTALGSLGASAGLLGSLSAASSQRSDPGELGGRLRAASGRHERRR